MDETSTEAPNPWARERDEPAGLLEGLISARQGKGPLLQRDYWAVIEGCAARPSEVMARVLRSFHDFAPPDLVTFRRRGDAAAPLAVGDEIDVKIRAAGRFGVRVVHLDTQSLTLATLAGHPEAGRITFGAYRNARGDVIFHIRSRARASTRARYLGFAAAGEAMQTNTWIDFVNSVACTFGRGVVGFIRAETRRMSDEMERLDAPRVRSPTFVAEGD